MGRKKGSYKFEKRQKELKKQKKKMKKLERRQNKGEGFEDEPQPTVDLEGLLVEPPPTDPETDPDN